MADSSAAKAAFAAGRFEEAVALFGDLLEVDPTNHLLLCNRSLAELEAGHTDEAVRDARSAILVAPDNLKAHYRLACAQHKAGRQSEALRAVDDAIAIGPASAQLNSLRLKIVAAGAASSVGPTTTSSAGGMRVTSRRQTPRREASPVAPPAEPAPEAQPTSRGGSFCRWLLNSIWWRPLDWLRGALGPAWRAATNRWWLPATPAVPTGSIASTPKPASAGAAEVADNAADAATAATAAAATATADADAAVSGRAGPPPPSGEMLAALPTEVFESILGRCSSMELVRIKCVCRGWAEASRSVLSTRGLLFAGTYSLRCVRKAAHPSSIWPEAEEPVDVESTGTLILWETGRVTGTVSETRWVSASHQDAEPNDSTTNSTVLGYWDSAGRLTASWALNDPNYGQRRVGRCHRVAVTETDVSLASQRWVLSGQYHQPSIEIIAQPPSLPLDSDEDADAHGNVTDGPQAAVTVELQLLYE